MLRLLEAEGSSHLDSCLSGTSELWIAAESRLFSTVVGTDKQPDLMVTKPNGLVLVQRDLRGLLYVRSSKHSNARERRIR